MVQMNDGTLKNFAAGRAGQAIDGEKSVSLCTVR